MSVPLYSRLSVTSKNDIRYEGVLVAVDEAAAALTLAQVKVFGTEGRTPGNDIAAFPNLFPSIVFRGADIKELKVVAGPPPAANPSPPVQTTTQPTTAARQSQAAPLVSSPPGQALPTLPEAPAAGSSGATQSRMTRLFQDSNNKPATSTSQGQDIKSPASNSKPATTGIQADKTQERKQHQQATSSTGAKRSVFDGAVASETAVVTVSGLAVSSSLGDVRKLFEENSANIVSLRLLSLPDGGTAADVVFGSKSDAEQAVSEFEHEGLSAALMGDSAQRFGSSAPRTASSSRGGRGGGRGFSSAPGQPKGRMDWQDQTSSRPQGPPQVFRGRGGARGSGNAWNVRQSESEESDVRSAPRRQHAARPEPKGDFDFEAANAKFDRDEFVAVAPASEKAKSSFFDDNTMHQTFESLALSGERGGSRRTNDRKKDAETFGAIAYTYRGGSGGRGRGRGGQRGGGGNNNRGGFRWNRPNRGEDSQQASNSTTSEGLQ